MAESGHPGASMTDAVAPKPTALLIGTLALLSAVSPLTLARMAVTMTCCALLTGLAYLGIKRSSHQRQGGGLHTL